MGIKYKSVKNLFVEKGIKYPELSIFDNRGKVIKVSYWQPLGEVEFDKRRGFYCKTSTHKKKAEEFLNFAKAEKIDVVITPEYSVPWDVLDEVIKSDAMWPQKGKLWCIGLEGISGDELEKFCDKYQMNESVHIITEDIEELTSNNFFSCIAYLVYSEKKLLCIIQFKTTPASDTWAELEALGLTTGNTIYYFEDTCSVNCLFSYICADALNQSISNIKNTHNFQKYIILHPQLNPKPLHDSFNIMRKSFLDFAKSNIRIISVNWSKGTLLRQGYDEKMIIVEDSYTACYYNEISTNNLELLIHRNKKMGMDISKDKHINIWHMPSNEHCMCFTINEFDTTVVNNVATNHNEPLGNMYLEYTEIGWEKKEACSKCSIDWNWLREVFNFDKCCNGECEVNELHKFFAILFGKKLYDDIKLRDGTSNVIFSSTNKGKEDVLRLRERCYYITGELNEGNVPAKFSKIKDGRFKWTLSKDGNLEIENDETKMLANVVYVDSSEEILINKAIIEFQNLMGEAAKDKMLLYYFTGKGIKYYEKIYNTNINNPNLTTPMAVINEGR